jgi:hypothetical protein
VNSQQTFSHEVMNMVRHRPNDTRYPFPAIAAGFIVGAGVAGALFLVGAPPPLIAIAAIGVTLLVISSVKYADQWEKAVLMRLGRYKGLRGPGYFAVIPILDRVAYTMILGTYAEYATVAAQRLVKLPAGIDFQTAAAVMLQGLTAHYLTHSTYPLSPGSTALVHAAAGGVGQLIVQVAKLRGATVYGTVGSAAKAEIARRAGADATIDYRTQDFAAEVKRLTNGRGVDVVLSVYPPGADHPDGRLLVQHCPYLHGRSLCP